MGQPTLRDTVDDRTLEKLRLVWRSRGWSKARIALEAEKLRHGPPPMDRTVERVRKYHARLLEAGIEAVGLTAWHARTGNWGTRFGEPIRLVARIRIDVETETAEELLHDIVGYPVEVVCDRRSSEGAEWMYRKSGTVVPLEAIAC
jgi:hypothetical protein